MFLIAPMERLSYTGYMNNRAREFAVEYHTHRTRTGVPDVYDGKPYVESHVSDVVTVLMDFIDDLKSFGVTSGQFDNLIKSAWLHDSVEDTEATISLIARRFGLEVARLVWAVTGIGSSRKIRNADMARKIALATAKKILAAILKLADRIANVEHSTKGSKHWQMYFDEMGKFEVYIRPYVPAAMWNRLLAAFELEKPKGDGYVDGAAV